MKISEEDVARIGNNRVALDKSNGYYRIYFTNGNYEYLHRFILNAQKGDIVDHIDRDRENNHRDNLRIVTKKLNNYNRDSKNSLGRGIYYDKFGDRYRACIGNYKKTLKLGSFKDITDAKLAYNKKALEIYGKDAYQHIIEKKADAPHFEIIVK
jgi:hypothetical protein